MGNRRSSLIAVDDQALGQQTAYTPSDLQVMTAFLPDFVHQYHSTKADQALILSHWEKLFAQSTQGGTATAPSPMVALFDGFYRHLFEIAPEVKPMFRSSMQVQGKALVRIVGAIKSMLQSPDLVEFAAALAKRHVHYGIKLPYFNALGNALLRTLRGCSEELWTQETEQAWRKVYAHVALIVLTELDKLDPSRRRSSLLQLLLSHRESSHQLNPHQGQQLDPNARCPMSGNRLGDVMAVPAEQGRSVSQRVLSAIGLGASTRYQQE